jgi:hypothetical protein
MMSVGTGKTLAALFPIPGGDGRRYRVVLVTVADKWVGETEKHPERKGLGWGRTGSCTAALPSSHIRYDALRFATGG